MIVGLVGRISLALALSILSGGLTAHGRERVDAMPADAAFAVVYFLDFAPLAAVPLPPGAREVSVARVSMLGRPVHLVGRHNHPDGPRRPLPADLFRAPIEVLEVIDGVKVAAGTKYEVSFGKPGSGQRVKYPHAGERTKMYFVQMYVGDDGVRRLAAHPLSRMAYDDWFKGWSDQQLERSRPGSSQ